jgi:energy-coupling factor transporter transmembrane protein EcfT
MALLVAGGWLVGLAAVELAFGLAWNREGLRPFGRPRIWLFSLSALVLGSLLLGNPDVALGPFQLSREGLVTGLEMAGRALALTLALGVGLSALSLSDLVAVLERLRLRGLGFALALAINLLGALQGMALVTLQTIWLRGGLRRPWLALRLFLITTVANTLRYGDDVINAAMMRAFDPDAGLSTTLPLRRADLWLLVALAGCTVLFLVGGTL